MYEIYCELRDSMGKKDAEIAKATSITKSTFSDWKSGRSTPKQDKLQKLAEFFGVSTDYLLGKNEDEIYDVEYNDEYQGINHIKEYLKETREEKGYSIEELSKETGISEKILMDYEDDAADVAVKSNLFKKILKAYGITQLDFEDSHGVLQYEARPEFHSDYNASFAFDQALERDQAVSSLLGNISSHEGEVIVAYRQQPEMQPAVDRLLGINFKTEPEIRVLAAHNDNHDEEQQELMAKDIERIRKMKKQK